MDGRLAGFAIVDERSHLTGEAGTSGALAFWRQVVGRHTGGRYEDVERDDERWRGEVLTFDVGTRDDTPTESRHGVVG